MAAFFKSWFRRTSVRSCSRQVNRFRPRLEALEDRLAPATFTVTSTADSLTSGTLRWAIQQVNSSSDPSDTIVINTGNYTLNAALGALVINPTVHPAKTVTIKGADPSNPGGTVVQGNGDRVFEIDGNNLGVHVLFQDLTITGGAPSAGKNGGGIFLNDPNQLPNVDSVALTNVILKGNTVSASAGSGGLGGGLYADRGSISVLGSIIGTSGAPNTAVRGGGIYAGAGTIFISNSIVANNTATGSGGIGGGGIYQAGNGAVTISGSILSNNQAQNGSDGGALYDAATLAPLFFVGSAVKNNNAAGNGGGLVYLGSNLTISNSHVDNNTAGGNGGGILIGAGNGVLTISGSILNGNSASGNGGAVENAGAALITIVGSLFSGNTASRGGALEDDQSIQMSVSNSTMSNNTATGSGGGALYLNRSIADYQLVNVILNGNSASTGSGGAIFVNNARSLLLNTVSMQNNTAGTAGGGLYNVAADSLSIFNSVLANDSAKNDNGGALYDLGSSSLLISGSIISGNLAKDSGGALFSSSLNAQVVGSAFNNNAAQSTTSGHGGGGIYIQGYGTWSFLNSQFINDVSAADGGALLVTSTGTGVALTIGSSVLLNNTAAMNGGAVAFEGGNNSSLTLDHSLVKSNTATGGSGGGVYATGQAATVTYSEVDSNLAGGNGGGIYLSNSGAPTWMVAYSTLASNTGGNGGGLYANGVLGGTLRVINATFVSNTASGNGGGIAIAGNSNKLTPSFLFVTVDNNSAQLQGGGIFNDEGVAAALGNTVVALNSASASGPDLFGRFADLVLGATTVGHNWIGNDPTTGYGGLTNGVNGDRLGLGNPLINSLGNNGGATLTQSLQPGSPLLNAALITADVQAVTTTDQRGVSRPQPSGTNGDIGAFESGLG